MMERYVVARGEQRLISPALRMSVKRNAVVVANGGERL